MSENETIKKLFAEMKLYNNPQELEDLKKVIKKNVPFTMRGYFSAYLYLKASLGTRPVKPAKADGTSLYINVGRQSRSSAKDLAAFVCKESGIESSQILSIVFKQNFSFVIVDNSVAEKVISAVNGKEFKGRKVKMNRSREKSEE